MRDQRGIALVTALILLILITLLGLAAIRSTAVQQKMSGNFQDRQLAFQSAEAGLQAGVQYVLVNGVGIVNCAAGGQNCADNPFSDPNVGTAFVHAVPTGTGNGQFTASDKLSGQPQFVVQDMGQYSVNNGASDTANGNQRGGVESGASRKGTPHEYYRITARSGDPDTIGARAVVTLQAYYKK